MEPVEKLIDKNYKYRPIDGVELSVISRVFFEVCGVADIFGERSKNIGVCKDAVATVIEQVRRRRLYFHVFHDMQKGTNELKETALYTFWILKLYPFFWKENDGQLSNFKLNAAVAIRFFTKCLSYYVDKKAKNGAVKKLYRANISEDIIRDIHYSFMFRDISKEAIMDLAKALIAE